VIDRPSDLNLRLRRDDRLASRPEGVQQAAGCHTI
jgi:hypothetical protein